MTLKTQLETVKENWILFVAAIIIIVVMTGGASIGPFGSSSYTLSKSTTMGGYPEDAFYAPSIARGGYYGGTQDFAPDVTDRLITKNANLGITTKHGSFTSAENQLKGIVSSTNSYLLSANANTYGEKGKEYRLGNYNIKVTADKYDAITKQLQTLGEVTSYSESQNDITGTVTSLETQLTLAREKLARVQKIYDSSENKEKVTLLDQLSYQEQQVKYLEDAVKNQGNRVTYSNIYVTISEEKPSFWNVQVVGFVELIKALVSSFNSLLYLLFVALPYAVAIAIIYGVYRIFKRKNNTAKKNK